ncbi:sulfatase-like hydrolase/transferase [Haladaptatus salinisoli]|uniref:sulfatase-like hydrolase/transferase n=1 Tax=Haladaptatus salinisoli TaxID=2884876 RepID=UPI001D0A4989|nr:sulfatase-like hydrolase/transferase [Haladaptatus salinisoli]
MKGERPDIALIVLDSVRASTFYELLDEKCLPVFKSLERDGVRYPQAITNGPWTVPSHGSIFTGMYPSQHGITGDNPTWNHPTFLKELSRVGYTTVGVSANPWLSPNYGFSDGFDYFLTKWEYFFNGEDMSAVVGAENWRNRLQSLSKNLTSGSPIKNAGNLAYLLYQSRKKGSGALHLASRAQNLLADIEAPSFFFANFTEAHLPYEPPRQHAEQHLPEEVSYEEALEINQNPWDFVSGAVDMSDRDFEVLKALYRASIQYLGEILNDLINFLKPETTVIIAGDHGENIGDFDLMDHQYSVQQTLLHVPLIISGPNTPTKSSELVELRDIYPTILDMAGIERETSKKGLSFHSKSTRKYAVSEYLSPRPDIGTLRSKSSKLRHDEEVYTDRRRVVQSNKDKLIYWEDGTLELVDLNDCSSCNEEKKEELSDVLLERIDIDYDANSEEEVIVNKTVENRLEELGYI